MKASILWAFMTPVSLAVPGASRLREVTTLASIPPQPGQALDLDAVLTIKIFMRQSSVGEGASRLLDISDPTSANYAQYWSHQQVADFFEPQATYLDGIKHWMNNSQIAWSRVRYSKYRGMIVIEPTVAEAEKLLQTRFHMNDGSIGYSGYSLPTSVKDSIDFVLPATLSGSSQGTSSSSRHRRSSSRPNRAQIRRTAASASEDLSNCSNAVSPECISALYGIPSLQGIPRADNSMGIFEAQQNPRNATYSQSDLNAFFAQYAPDIPTDTHPVPAGIDGAAVVTDDPHSDEAEAMLDYEVALPIIYPQTVTAFVNEDSFYPSYGKYNGSSGRGVERFLDAIDAAFCQDTGASNDTSLDCGKYQPTNVISFSQSTIELAIDYDYAMRVCDEFMKLGLQGVTVMASSGDQGVGRSCEGANDLAYVPEWFSTCPWVTSVGGTQLQAGANVSEPGAEVGWGAYNSVASSGGGFSNYYPMPDYQKNLVSTYLANPKVNRSSYSGFATSAGYSAFANNTNGVFNRAGRGYPDVSALASNITTYYNGTQKLSFGTSASAPLWGAIITRINEERLNAGKKPVGFINPTLYQNPSVFNDIVSGTVGGFCGAFPAVEGWDAMTGLGSPNYSKLLNLFMGLP